MSIDLQHSLADLAGSVHDDALATRLTAQVGPMVGRIRRRRAARTAAVGTVSMGTVAAMAVGAFALSNRGDGGPTPGPASEAPAPPAPVPHDGEPLECSDALPDALVSDDALAVAGETPTVTGYGSDLMTTLRWWAPGTEEVTYTDARIDVALARDGVVVGVTGQDSPSDVSAQEVTLGSTETGTVGAFSSQLIVDPCGGDTPLDAGEYRVVATITLTSGAGDTWRASTGPWPLTIEPAPVDGEIGGETQAQGEAAVQDIIAAAPEITAVHPFGTCGTLVPTGVEDEPLALELDLDSGSGMLYTPGDVIDAVTILTPAGGRPSVVADLPDTGATVVLVRDGVVVGRGAQSEDGASTFEVTDAAQVFYGAGEVQLCSLPGTDAPAADLPPGIYEAYAVMPVTLQQVTEADGTTRPATGKVVVRSRPVDVIVQEPRD